MRDPVYTTTEEKARFEREKMDGEKYIILLCGVIIGVALAIALYNTVWS